MQIIFLIHNFTSLETFQVHQSLCKLIQKRRKSQNNSAFHSWNQITQMTETETKIVFALSKVRFHNFHENWIFQMNF